MAMSEYTPMTDAKIPLYTFYNAAFERLKDRFLATIKDDYDIHCIRCDFDTGGQPIDKAVDMFIARGKIIRDAIRENLGGIIILADIDIQFFRPTEPIVRKALESHRMVFQKGDVEKANRSKNMGFIALRCDEKILAFWSEVLEEIRRTERWEEIIVNEMLEKESAPDFGLFPDQIWTPMLIARPEDIALHHAINSGPGEKGKIEQMDRVVDALKHGTFGSFSIPQARDSFMSLMRHVNMQRKSKGARVAFCMTLPSTLYSYFIDRNIGRVGIFIRKASPRLYAKLKPYAAKNA